MVCFFFFINKTQKSLNLQRNHTLFGSVWSSMRRKGQAPFGKRGIANKLNSKGNNKNDKNNTIDGDGDGDFLYNSMRQVVSEGMNHITKTLMQSGGYDDSAGIIGSDNGDYNIDSIGDLVNSAGELQTRGQENIPLRPLVVNNNNNMTSSQNIPYNGLVETLI